MFASRAVPTLRRPLVALMIIAGAIACGEIITGPDDDAATRPRSMRITPAQLRLAQAETSRVTATLHAASGAVTEVEPGQALFYRSSDASIASVDSLTGLVTALTDGTVSVQAVYGALTLGIPVQVLARPRFEVVSGQGQVGEQGDTLAARLVVRALDAAGSPIADTAVTFTALTGGGALQEVSERTDASGIAQARWELGLEIGAQSVEVTSPGLDAVAFTATVTAGTSVASIEIAPVSESLVGVGATRQLTAVAFNKAHVALPGAVFAWTSADESIATVDATGLVTAVADGSTHIRATSDAVADSVIVVVEIPVVTAKLDLGADVEHPAGLQVARTLALPVAVAAPTIVTLISLDTNNVKLALDEETRGRDSVHVLVPAGATTATYWLQGVEGTVGGFTRLVAEAPGHEPDTIEVTNVQPAAQLTLIGPSSVPASGGDDPVLLVTVGRNDGGTLVPMAVRAFGDPPTFDVFAHDQVRAMVIFRATAATIGADNGPTICAAFDLRPRYSATSMPNAEFETPASLSISRAGVPGIASFGLASLSGYEVIGGPVTITLTSTGTPIIGVTPATVTFSTPFSGGDPDERTLTVTNEGTGTLSGLSVNVAYAEGASDWLAATLDATTAPTVIRLQPSVAGLAVGTYGVIVEIISAVTSEVTEVQVELTVTGAGSAPKLSLGPDIRHPAQLQAMYAVTLPAVVDDELPVAITVSDVTGAVVSSRQQLIGTAATEIEVEGGTAVGDYWIQGQVRGSERLLTIIASAAGYEPDTMFVTMIRPSYALSNIEPGTRPAVGGEDPAIVLTVGMQVDDGDFTWMMVSPGIELPSFTLQADQPSVGLLQFFPGEMVLGPAQGPATTVTFALQAGSNGTSDGRSLVEPPNIRMARTGVGGVGLVSVVSAPSEFNAMTATTGYTFTAAPVPVISVDPGTLSYVAVGGVATPIQRTIAISNGGIGTLSGLATEVAYGAGASNWLGVSLDATTAPATLTAEASPEFLPVGTFTATITISSTVPDVAPVNIDVTLTITAIGRIVIVSGDGQEAGWNELVPDSIKVRVLDTNDQPVSNVYVFFIKGPNGGDPYPSNPMTDADGYAATTWTMSRTPGTYTLSATRTGFTSAVFTGTSLAGTAVTRLEISAARTTFTGAGETEQFTAAAYNIADSLITSAEVTWESQTPAVATISATGLLTTVAPGQTWIVARVGDVHDMQQVIVNAPVVCDLGHGALTVTGAPPTVEGAFCPQTANPPTGPNLNGDMHAVWQETYPYGGGSYREGLGVLFNPTTGVVSSVGYHLNDPTRSITWGCSTAAHAPPPCTNVSVNLATRQVTFSGLLLGTSGSTGDIVTNPITFTGTLTFAPPLP